MKFYADLHIHSKYSRATSLEMNIVSIAKWAKIKGLSLVGTGDFTHPLWLEEIKSHLKESSGELYECENTYFMLTTEVNNIFVKNDRVRKVHNLIFAPDIQTVEKINKKLSIYGNLLADGRPTLNLPAKEMLKIILDISESCLVIPAHAWTPHFALFGSNAGFDSIEECFEELTGFIKCIETGLSSDPPMNWRLSKLDEITLISNSDAHSPAKIAREANAFDCNLNYIEIIDAIKNKDPSKLLFTIEFYPQEGKYHYDGHRNCNLRLHPRETRKYDYICPICNKKITVGVLHRVEELSDRDENFIPQGVIGYRHLIPLQEIIAEVLNLPVESRKVKAEYFQIVNYFGSELKTLLEANEEELYKVTSKEIAEGIIRVRNSDVEIECGYDGVYGKIKIRKPFRKESKIEEPSQLDLFN